MYKCGQLVGLKSWEDAIKSYYTFRHKKLPEDLSSIKDVHGITKETYDKICEDLVVLISDADDAGTHVVYKVRPLNDITHMYYLPECCILGVVYNVY